MGAAGQRRSSSHILPPNVPGTNNYSTAAFNLLLQDDKGSVRGDAQTRYGRLSAYYMQDNSTVTNPQDSAAGKMPGFSTITPLRAQLAVLDDTKVFSSSLVNDATISYLRMATIGNEPLGGLGVPLTTQGFVAGGLGIVPANSYEGVQGISLSGQDTVSFRLEERDRPLRQHL